MALEMKGRITIRRELGAAEHGDPSQPRLARSRAIHPWAFEAKPDSTLARLEAAYLSALEAVDQIEDHKAAATKSGKFTPDGVSADALQFAARTLGRSSSARSTPSQQP
jgi:hypothetical protein